MNWKLHLERVLRFYRILKETLTTNRMRLTRWSLYFAAGVFVLLILTTIFQFLIFLYYKDSIYHELDSLKSGLAREGQREGPKQIISIFDRNNLLLGEYNRGATLNLSLKQCNLLGTVQKTLIAAEDQDFYSHSGFSFKGVLRAFWRNLISFQIRQGGGTITQQLARNLFTERKRNSISRKIYETILAFYIESKLGKSEILCLYVNKAYFGQNSYGIEEASRFYFNKPASKLSYAEAALLVGILPAPSLYNPVRNTSSAMKKQKSVLDLLVKTEILAEKEAAKKANEFRAFYQIDENDPENPYGRIAKSGTNKLYRVNHAPELNEYIIKYLYDTFESVQNSTENVQIYTTIELTKQVALKRILNGDIDSLRWSFRNGSKLGYEEAKNYSSGIQGVVITMEPRTGEVLAISGGGNLSDPYQSMTRAFYMKRQVGSALKGFLYSAAIEEGIIDENTELDDSPVNIAGYKPRNWYGSYLGKISVAKALQRSVNTVAVKVLKDLGISKYIDYIQDGLGLSSFETKRFPKNLTLALGSADFSLLEVGTLYSEIVNGGTAVEPAVLRKVVVGGDTYYQNDSIGSGGKRIFKESTCASILEFLKSVFETGGTASWIGDKKKRNSEYLNYDIAGKSGTVESENATYEKLGLKGSRDVWFVGLTPTEVTVVWFGHDEGVPIPGSGSSVAASTWAKYAQTAIRPKEDARSFLTNSSPMESVTPPLTEESSTEENDSSENDPKDEKQEGPDSSPSNEEKIYVAPEEKAKG
ncbi:transglycosylase [Leptospira weilii serovar Ranarum str. ICFT]|uniref:Transglycosylase n=1 Tax=Leptospira weilii serovar Ranarum str. ICFT TaxID=1218598 RepID=N1WKX4_9LEPT|nr:transglycosylase domain-containing protein [Leptospira weilii]EMY77784.1 transglycosylase [Leptospira weilii serovar Ranarum str. ICFT]